MPKELLRFKGTSIERVDDPAFREDIARDLQRYRADFKKLNAIFPELVKEHLHEWAGIYEGKLYTAPTLEELDEKAKEDSVDLNEAVYMFVITEEELKNVLV
ncbi:MAG: hypothetical protein EXR50_00215 [Dehalococcoidia bacterium]|nr:hypothetical protein [Dehalococcoidia bacterium]